MFNIAKLTPGINRQSITELKIDLDERLLIALQQNWTAHVPVYTLVSGITDPYYSAVRKHLNQCLMENDYSGYDTLLVQPVAPFVSAGPWQHAGTKLISLSNN